MLKKPIPVVKLKKHTHILIFQSVWLHLLGEEAVESEEKDTLAAWDARWRAGGDHAPSWDSRTSYDHRDTGVCWEEGEFYVYCDIVI